MDAAAAHLLNFSAPLDCSLLEQLVAIAMDGSHPQRAAANEFLVKIKEHPDMWRRADSILEMSNDPATKFFGLQVLTEAINTHWKVIPADQREGIRNYVVMKVIGLSSSEESLKREHQFLSRLNVVLVQILKQDWPQNWPNFISDLVAASKTSETLCENNMKILQLLSEDVFDFSKESLTAIKVKNMKESLMGDFQQIYGLCEFILTYSQKPSLIVCTLTTLQRFLSWIPLGYIFETNLLSGLITKFLPKPYYRVAVVDCLIEVASLPPADLLPAYRPIVHSLFVAFVQTLQTILPPPRSVSLAQMYENASEQDCLFISHVGLFLSTFLKSYLAFFESCDNGIYALLHETAVYEGFWYLLAISKIDDDEIFKSCLEFWFHFSKDLYTVEVNARTSGSTTSLSLASNNSFISSFGGTASAPRGTHKYTLYDSILHELRIVMIDKMAKPEEVIIVEDDNGEIVREMTKDTEVIAQYKTMKEALVYLTHLNTEATEQIMLEKLDLQVAGGMFTWQGLNTLCWAIGSISGAMLETDEKRFLVSVIKDLLRLCEEQRGKDNKAVVASNIMYIVGQYPRFLRAHWKFLKTVVNKLFEFMHELHPGVQDMACDTFLKIAQKCKRKFMTQQVDEPEPYIMSLIKSLGDHTKDLQPHQVQSFYESMGTMLSDSGPAISLPRDTVMLRLMELQNEHWKHHMTVAAQGEVAHLFKLEVVKDLTKIVKINIKVCQAAGAVYLHQLSFLFQDLLSVYRLYGERVREGVAQHGVISTRWTDYKALRQCKSEILELLTATLTVATEHGPQGVEMYKNAFFPLMLQDVLQDYGASPPAARDSKAITLFSTALTVFKDKMGPELAAVVETIFDKTLEMITQNMQDFPDHRHAFFAFLRHANMHSFYALFSIPAQYQKLVVDSVVWAFKHTERNISETGLEILSELLQNIAQHSGFAQSFYAAYLLPLLQDVFSVLTDRLHKSGFAQQSAVLQQMFLAVQAGGVITVPLSSTANAVSNANDTSAIVEQNVVFVKEHLAGLLGQTFPNLTKAQIALFVRGCFEFAREITVFKQHLRDFLVEIKEFAAEDNSDLFLEEQRAMQELQRREEMQYLASVPGLIKPVDLQDQDE